jgi:hypothetical protein
MRKYQYIFLSLALIISMSFVHSSAVGMTSELEPPLQESTVLADSPVAEIAFNPNPPVTGIAAFSPALPKQADQPNDVSRDVSENDITLLPVSEQSYELTDRQVDEPLYIEPPEISSTFVELNTESSSEYQLDYTESSQQKMLEYFIWLNAYYDERIKEYGLVFPATESDTVYDLVPKKKLFVEQFQEFLGSISIEPTSLDKDNGYRFQVKLGSVAENSSFLQALPDQLRVIVIGGKSQLNLWTSVYSQTIDLSPLKTSGGTVDLEMSANLNDNYDQLLLQAYAEGSSAGNFFITSFIFELSSTEEDEAT